MSRVATTRSCPLNRAVRDHTATPSCWRRVDGVEAMIIAVAETRRDNLIYALAGLLDDASHSRNGSEGLMAARVSWHFWREKAVIESLVDG